MLEPQGIIPTDRKEGECRIFESVSGRRSRICEVSSDIQQFVTFRALLLYLSKEAKTEASHPLILL